MQVDEYMRANTGAHVVAMRAPGNALRQRRLGEELLREGLIRSTTVQYTAPREFLHDKRVVFSLLIQGHVVRIPAPTIKSYMQHNPTAVVIGVRGPLHPFYRGRLDRMARVLVDEGVLKVKSDARVMPTAWRANRDLMLLVRATIPISTISRIRYAPAPTPASRSKAQQRRVPAPAQM